jgi:hypothetical protein
MAEGDTVGESGTGRTQPQAVPPINYVRVVPDIPVVFTDGIASHAWTPNVSKFYFVRFDSDPNAQAEGTQSFVAQIVIPNDRLVSAVSFLEHRLKKMINAGVISQKTIDDAKKYWEDNG